MSLPTGYPFVPNALISSAAFQMLDLAHSPIPSLDPNSPGGLKGGSKRVWRKEEEKIQGRSAGLKPRDVNVPVVSGHAGVTILPPFSGKPSFKLHPRRSHLFNKPHTEWATEVVEGDAGIVEGSFVASQVQIN